MAPKSKGLTSGFALRMNDDERTMVEQMRARYADAGIRLSLNDTLRRMIVMSAIRPPRTYEDAVAMVKGHTDVCPVCEYEQYPVCPEGWNLFALVGRFAGRAPSAGRSVVGD